MTTLEMLIARYGGPHMNTSQLAECLEYASRNSVLEAVARGDFPVRTFKLRHNCRVADIRDVAEYLDKQRAEAA